MKQAGLQNLFNAASYFFHAILADLKSMIGQKASDEIKEEEAKPQLVRDYEKHQNLKYNFNLTTGLMNTLAGLVNDPEKRDAIKQIIKDSGDKLGTLLSQRDNDFGDDNDFRAQEVEYINQGKSLNLNIVTDVLPKVKVLASFLNDYIALSNVTMPYEMYDPDIFNTEYGNIIRNHFDGVIKNKQIQN